MGWLLSSMIVAVSACGGGGSSTGDSTLKTSSGGGGSSSSDGGGATANGSYTVAGNISSIEGIDSVGRGYRDDVAQLISDKYSTIPSVKSAAGDAAKAYQKSLTLDLATVASTTGYLTADAIRGACAVHKAGVQNGPAVIQAIDAIYARTFNTPERMAQRKAFVQKAPASFSVDLPDADHC